MTPAVRAPALALNAFALFFFSFLMSGIANVIPQLFFERNDPAQKTVLLSAALFASTLAAAAGVLASRRIRARPWLVAAGVASVAAAFESLFSLGSAPVYIALLVLVQFGDNFLLNQVDHAAAARAAHLRGFNDAAGNGARLLGMMLAPAFFTVLARNIAAERITVAAFALVALCGACHLLAFPAARIEGRETAGPERPPEPLDRLVFGYAIAIYIALYLFAANMIYLLGDVLRLDHPETRGGAAIVLVFVSALLSNSAVAILKRRVAAPPHAAVKIPRLLSPGIALFACAAMILSGVRAPYGAYLAGAGVVGAAYGIFLWEVRDYSSRGARRGKTGLLTWFNNMANVSSIAAFALMFFLAAARAQAPGTYYTRIMLAIGGLPAIAIALLVWLAPRSKHMLKAA